MKVKRFQIVASFLGMIFGAAVLVAIVLSVGYVGFKFTEGYWKAGSWQNDPENYKRAFGHEKPSEIIVVNSNYTRYPHFTLEQKVYFEFIMPDSMMNNWIYNGWEPVRESEKVNFVQSFTYDSIDWFVRDSLSNYKLFRVTDESSYFPTNLMAIDTTTGHVFYGSIQL